MIHQRELPVELSNTRIVIRSDLRASTRLGIHRWARRAVDASSSKGASLARKERLVMYPLCIQ